MIRRYKWRIALVTVLTAPLLVLAGFLHFVPPPVEPFAPHTWVPPEPVSPRTQTSIGEVESLTTESLNSPEDIAVDDADRLYMSTRDGLILRFEPDAGKLAIFADVGGRPLGLHFTPDGELLVANQGVGLQAVDPSGEVRLLTDMAGGQPIASANDLTVAADGTVYLTDSNRKYTPDSLGERTSYSLYDFLEGRPLGRVIAYDPSTARTNVIAENLYFPNGIVLAADEESVLVAETTRYRVTRLWVESDRTGQTENFLANVPGITDGFTRDADGRLILGTYQRVAALDEVLLPSTIARQIAVRLPEDILTGDPLPGSLLELSEDGDLLASYTGLDPAATTITPWRDTWILGALQDAPLRAVEAPDPL